MRADKDDKLKALLKQAGTDKPTEGFTNSVMQMVEADAAREAALQSILKKHPVEGPSFDFTASVMRQITAKHKPLVIQPIITKKAWFVIAAMFTLFLIIAFLPGRVNTNAVAENSRLTMLINKVQFIPSAVVLAIVLGAILMIGDYVFTKYRKGVIN